MGTQSGYSSFCRQIPVIPVTATEESCLLSVSFGVLPKREKTQHLGPREILVGLSNLDHKQLCKIMYEQFSWPISVVKHSDCFL